MIRPERNAESPCAFNNDKIGVLPRVAQACGNLGEIDFDAGLGLRQMGRDGRRKTVGVAYLSGQGNVAGLTDTAHIVIFAIRFDPGCHRFQSGGAQAQQEGDLAGGYYVQPTLFKGHNKMRIFQEEIFGPVLAVTTFKDEAEALAIANDTLYGLGAGVWSRNGNVAYRMGRAIKAGRVWTNCYHAYPAHAAFGGYKESGLGRENHKMALGHYQQTKNLLVSYSEDRLGFF